MNATTKTYATNDGPAIITARPDGTATLTGTPAAIEEILADFPGRDWSTLAACEGGVILDPAAAREIAPNEVEAARA